MGHSFPVYFETLPLQDVVTVAVVPLDAFSCVVVTRGIKASVDGLPDRPIRNRSGHLVFVNLPPQPQYTIAVDASAAGYFSPAPSDFVPGGAHGLRHEVRLQRRAEFSFDDGTTLVRGDVCRGADRLPGALVWCLIAALPPIPLRGAPIPPPLRFETRTNVRGAFALPLRLPFSAAAGAGSGTFDVSLNLSEGGDARVLPVSVREGKTNIFEDTIDIIGVGEPPGFFERFTP